jgi:hypothetical protein
VVPWLTARRVLTAVVVLVVVSPAIRDRDSFPLSTYPVYASARSEVVSLSTAIGVTADGDVHRLSLDAIARTDDPLVAESAVDDAIDAGRADALCAAIAARTPDRFTHVEVVEERHDVIAHVVDGDGLVDRTVHARCEVP